ncbi:MAG TPA: DNA recombination protein RmuC [Candidatus Yonathbacteria bacterium]|nr:DNA recombination protein RmuC [Candidatus Yonathbacteria bacterium]
MDSILLIFIGLAIGAIVAFIFVAFLRKQSDANAEPQGDALMLIQNQLGNFQAQLGDFMKTVDAKVGSSNKEMQQAVHMQFSESQKLIREINEQVERNLSNVAKEMTTANETSKQVLGITDQLQNLEKVLTHQKQRGNLGEAALELILSNILPPTAYKLQYQFKSGETVDAVIITKDGMIPVDAKFSLDNYNRVVNETDGARKEELEKDFRSDLKKRIDETAKYVRPSEGTLPFAFMFIPAEGIYYDLLVNEVGAVKVNTRSLIDYATNEKKVIIVSPTTFSAYLQSVLYGFRAFKIEESAQLIIGRVEELRKHLVAYEDYMKKLGSTLGTTVNHYNTAYKELKKVDKDMVKITGETASIDPLLIEKPAIEE